MKGKRSRDGGADLPTNGVAKKVKTASGKSPAGSTHLSFTCFTLPNINLPIICPLVGASLADMSMDDFLDGGFMSGPTASGTKKKRGGLVSTCLFIIPTIEGLPS